MDDADGTTLPPVSESATGPAASPLWDGFAEGSQKTKVQGEVLRWHNEHGATSMPAAEYITMLENEVAALRKQVCGSGNGQSSRMYSTVSCIHFGI